MVLCRSVEHCWSKTNLDFLYVITLDQVLLCGSVQHRRSKQQTVSSPENSPIYRPVEHHWSSSLRNTHPSKGRRTPLEQPQAEMVLQRGAPAVYITIIQEQIPQRKILLLRAIQDQSAPGRRPLGKKLFLKLSFY
jgi:hypothetical protein